MVVLNKIYTRTGDDGDTALGDGSRVSKGSLRVSAYGAVDESNAVLGMARLHADQEMDQVLSRIQNDLFDVGADLCTPMRESYEYEPLRVVEAQVTWLEACIDRHNAELEPLRSFILPAGSAFSAAMHLARTTVRRAERDMVLLAEKEDINSHAVSYVNRLSDLCFVLARFGNDKGKADVLWVPGANR